MRREFFGPDGDTLWNVARLKRLTSSFTHHDVHIRDHVTVADLVKHCRPDLIVHRASQPSHDLAKDRPLDDFDINPCATLGLLEAARTACPFWRRSSASSVSRAGS